MLAGMNRKNTLCAPAAALFAAHAQPSTDPAQIIVVTATRHAMALVDAPAAMSGAPARAA